MAGLRLMLALAGGIVLTGCETSKQGPTDGYYVVTSKQAQVYRFGPSQPTGADAILAVGQKVRMLRKEFGYSRVMTEDGMSGYISNDFIAPTTPPERPKTGTPGDLGMNLPPLPPRGGESPGMSSANRSVLQTAPLFGGEELPPLPDGGERPAFRPAKPKPGFRFKVPAPSEPSPEKP
jgi:hypothetical protein